MRTFSRPFLLLLFVAAACCAGIPASFLCLSALPARAQDTDNVFTGHVVAVTAGDTMDVRVGDDWTVTVRLHGVECPTRPRLLRETATRYTSRLVLDTDVRVAVRGTASRSVVYGEVFPGSGGESVNFKLARDGVATWAREYAAQRTDLGNAEAYAKSARRGLWGSDDGSNIALPASAADAKRREAEASAAAKAARVRERRPEPDVTKPVLPEPELLPEVAPVEPSPRPTREPDPVRVAPDAAATTIFSAPLIGGISVGVLAFLSLVAYGVAYSLPFAPKRLVCQVALALIAGALGAMAFALPAAGWQKTLGEGTTPAPLLVASIGPLVAVPLLWVGFVIIRSAARLRGAAADPRRAESGSVKLHGTARSVTGKLVRSEIGRVKGLYVREVTARYTAEAENGKRNASPRWVTVRDTAGAVDFEIFSSAGDGTGSALVLAAQEEGAPQSLAPARWIPYHVARFYNEVPSAAWFATAYEGDTRTEVFFVPNGATLTVWGSLYTLAASAADIPVMPAPRVASDSALGALLICDGPEARAYAGRGVDSLPFGIGWGLVGGVCAAGAFWGVLQDGDMARRSAVASLAVGLAVLVLLAIRRGSVLARNAYREERGGETDPLRRPASAVWKRYGRTFPGSLIAPAVGD
ncbi:MAG: thermonuclease family protein [Akkermansiaceae bacterium]|nr:thermonuclease family protein [Armatimonadota bacterium]